MPRGKAKLASSLTVVELRSLLAVKEKMVALEAKKAKLESELAAVNASLRKIASASATAPKGKPRRKARRPRKKTAAVAKAAASKKVARKKTRGAKVRRSGRTGATLQEVVAGLIRQNGKPMEFQTILGTIRRKKLVTTRSANFANVLRRTLSTSTRIKRVARGTYGLAK